MRRRKEGVKIMADMLEMVETSEGTRQPVKAVPDLELSEAPPLSDEALELSTRPVVILESMVSSTASDLRTAEQALELARSTFENRTQRQHFRSDLAHASAVEEHAEKLRAA